MQRRLPGVETTDVEVHMATYSLFATDRRRLLTGSTNSIKTVVEITSGKSHATALINVRTSAYDFIVKLSSCICSHTDSSCPGCWLM